MKQIEKSDIFIYHSISKEASERIRFEDKLKNMKTYMMNHRDEEFTFGPMYKNTSICIMTRKTKSSYCRKKTHRSQKEN